MECSLRWADARVLKSGCLSRCRQATESTATSPSGVA